MPSHDDNAQHVRTSPTHERSAASARSKTPTVRGKHSRTPEGGELVSKGVRGVLAIAFIACIFVVGAVTLWNCRSTVKALPSEKSFVGVKETLEGSITDNFAARNQWVNLNGGFQRLLGVTVVRGSNGDTYKLSNGQIMYTLDDRKMDYYADQLVSMRDQMSELGIGFMYVQYPFKIQDDSVMPPGTHSAGNSNADSLVSKLRDKGVDTLDIRDNIAEEGLDWSSLFFKTDHHWTPAAGLWASGKMMERISGEYGFKADMSCYDLDNYDMEIYDDWLLGSIARRTGAWYAGVEDFYLLNPKFDTDFVFWGKVKGEKVSRSGSFRDSVYDFSLLQDKATFDLNTFETYTGGQYKTARFINKKATNDFKILMIRDSFTSVTLPFLAMNVSEVTTMDLRRYKKSTVDYIKKYKPDLVIVAYNPSSFSKKMFNFFGK